MHGKTIEIRFYSLVTMFYNFSAISLRVDFIGSEEEVFSGGKSFIFMPADIVGTSYRLQNAADALL